MLYYGKTHSVIHSNREIVSNYTVFNGIIKSYTVTETYPCHLDMYAFNNGTSNNINVFCVYRDFYVGKMSDVEQIIHQNMDTSIKWHQKINTHECIGDLHIYWKIIANNWYGIGLLLVLLFISLRILITIILIGKIQTYNDHTRAYLLKNLNMIIALNIIKIIGFTVLFHNWLRFSNSDKKFVVCEMENYVETNESNVDKYTKYCLDDRIDYVPVIMIVSNIGVIGVSWFVLIKFQNTMLNICIENNKINNQTYVPVPDEETPFNIQFHEKPIYG